MAPAFRSCCFSAALNSDGRMCLYCLASASRAPTGHIWRGRGGPREEGKTDMGPYFLTQTLYSLEQLMFVIRDSSSLSCRGGSWGPTVHPVKGFLRCLPEATCTMRPKQPGRKRASLPTLSEKKNSKLHSNWPPLNQSLCLRKCLA